MKTYGYTDFPVVLIVRYSLYSQALAGNWRIGRRSVSDYKKRLFAPQRLALHQELFKDITLPSILCQTRAPSVEWFTLLLITSTELPAVNRRFIHDLLQPYDWARIVEMPAEQTDIASAVTEVAGCFASGSSYLTTRLDDDDGLAADFFERMGKYVNPRFEGYCISFGKGFAASYKGPGQFDYWQYYRPKTAAGLSMVHTADGDEARPAKPASILQAGNHTQVDTRRPLIVDSREPAFIRVVHDQADSGSASRLKKKPLPPAEPDEVKRYFPFVSV